MSIADEMFGLPGRRAVITGAAQGIGRAIAKGFADLGAEVVLIDRDGPALEDCCAEIGASSSCHVLDLSGASAISGRLDSELRAADIFVANAGAMAAAPLAESSRDLFETTMSTHVFSHVDLLRPALAGMSERGYGRVILMASIAAWRSRVPTPAYSAAKGAVVSLTRSIAQEYGACGIVCNAIAPGPIRTAMSRASQEDPQIEEALRHRIAVGRWGEPSDILPLAVLLASGGAGFISGQVVTVDGGASTNV